MLSALHRKTRLRLPIAFVLVFFLVCLVQYPIFRSGGTSEYFLYGSSLLQSADVGRIFPGGSGHHGHAASSDIPFEEYLEDARPSMVPELEEVSSAQPPPAAATTGSEFSNGLDPVEQGAMHEEPPMPVETEAPTTTNTDADPSPSTDGPEESVESEAPSEPEQAVEPSEPINPILEDPNNLGHLPMYIKSILDPSDETIPRLQCEANVGARYAHLAAPISTTVAGPNAAGTIKYFFALDLFEVAPLLPRLLSSVLAAIKHLGPSNCALSIVEGRSGDLTFSVLEALAPHLADLGVVYYLNTSALDPLGGPEGRIEALADLRNLALAPLTSQPHLYHPTETIVTFLNDISLCPHDILEILHQHVVQDADMTCAMDWIFGGRNFYDIWVSRALNGDTFFEVPQDGSWRHAEVLFWNDPASREKFDRKEPFQVYACWNGIAAFTASPLLKPVERGGVRFRHSEDEECFMGEPTLFCKDFWRKGKGKIQIVPTVNVGYDDEEGQKVKELRGRVEDSVDVWREERAGAEQQVMIDWQMDPPGMVKCVPEWSRPSWVAPL